MEWTRRDLSIAVSLDRLTDPIRRLLSISNTTTHKIMPLGLLAKDSIQDLASLAREPETGSSTESGKDVIDGTIPTHERLLFQKSGADANTHSSVEHASLPLNASDASVGRDETNTSTTTAPATAIANPQQADEKETNGTSAVALPPASSAQYSGFAADYADYRVYHDDPSYSHQSDSVYHDPYAPTMFLAEARQKPNWLGCLFPFFFHQHAVAHAPAFGEHQYSSNANHLDAANANSPTTDPARPPGDDDEMSSGSDVFGEKLSQRERQAVLARLRLGQPDTPNGSATGPNHTPGTGPTGTTINPRNGKGLLNGISTYDQSPLNSGMEDGSTNPLKGILKNITSLTNVKHPGTSQSSGKNSEDPGASSVASTVSRRSLFPTAYEKPSGPRHNLHVAFAPMARVVTVKSKNDMSAQEKADVWWQRHDYDDFRKTGRIITRAMVEGGSEIWLTSDEVKPTFHPSGRGQATSHSTSVVSHEERKKQDPASDAGDTISEQRDKWWHKFGHSRRGLEHVVSMDEGRERQQNVRSAIRAVLEEQNMQTLYKKPDSEKLRSVALKHTTWARDLALASGASDADAVKANFAEDRKSREFYLLKMARTNPTIKTSRLVPGFMQPCMRTPGAPTRTKTFELDNHTSTQIRYRRQIHREDEEKKNELSEPVRDPDPEEHGDTLAKRAAGFSSEGDEKVNMAAVLSGMGAVPQEPPSVKV